MAFINLFEIPLLSDCVVVDKVTEMMEPCPKVQKYVHKVTSFIQAFLCTDFPEVYQKLVTELDIVNRLTKISFWKVNMFVDYCYCWSSINCCHNKKWLHLKNWF